MAKRRRRGFRGKRIRQLGFVLIIFSLWMTGTAQAAPFRQDLIVEQVQVLEDPSTTATLDQILARRQQFTDLHTTPNYGFTASAYWLRIPVQNQHDSSERFYLDIKQPGIDYVTLYVVSQGSLRETVQSGDKLPAHQRPYLATTLVLPFHLTANGTAELYVRVSSEGAALFIPFEVAGEEAFQATFISGWVLHSVVLGILGALFIYNLLIFSLLRTRLYLYYVLYLPAIYIVIAGISGFGPAYLYPNNVWLGNNGVGVFNGIGLALMLLMTREFLQTWHHRWLDRWVQFFMMAALASSVGVFLWSPRFGYQLTAVVLLFYPAFCFLVGLIAWRHGQTEARFYLVGQVASWSSMVLFTLLNMGVLTYHLLIFQSPAIGIAGDALLLSLALADQIRHLQQARQIAEERARQNLEIHREELEQLVAKRTAEIKTLQGILPICANCKKIRDDQGAWQQLEAYISQHTDAQFSHGLCADCIAALYPEIYRKRQQQ